LEYHWEGFQTCFITQTRDTSRHAYDYMRGQLTMDAKRHFAGIGRQVGGHDGQSLQHFMSNSPWDGSRVYEQIQAEICERPQLAQGSMLVLDESADEKAGTDNAGSSRQYNGRMGKIDVCQVGVVLSYVNWKSGPWPIWTWVDGELFLPEEWFTPAFAHKRQKLEIPEDRRFATKIELGLAMIQRAKQRELPFEGVACDELYGRSSDFRAQLEQAGLRYAADIPSNLNIYLQKPKVGIPKKRAGKRGRHPKRLRVLNGVLAETPYRLARSKTTQWHCLRVRANERGFLEAHFATWRVWTWSEERPEPRAEWLIIRREEHGNHTYTLSNASPDTPLDQLVEPSCTRYFVERTIQDGKAECGWDEFQAQKYPAWAHHTALTACTLWFIAKTKLKYALECARDPDLIQQLEVEVLPALSTANVRELMKAVLPLPQLSTDQARSLVAKHLVNRSRSTASRLRNRSNAPP
jgi:SRSO17 transposase